MDPKSSGVLLSLTAFPGVNSNAPRGTQPAPDLLQNVHLDRTGGYTPMSARSKRLESVTRALSANRADNLFVEQGGAVQYFDGRNPSPTLIHNAPATLADAVTIMPDLLLIERGKRYLTPRGPADAFGTFSASDLTFSYGNPGEGNPGFDGTKEWDLLIVAVPDQQTKWSGTVLMKVGAGHGAPTPNFVPIVTVESDLGNLLLAFTLYMAESGVTTFREVGRSGTILRPIELGGNPYAYSRATGNPNYSLPEGQTPFSAYFDATTDSGTATTYHQGRVWLAPTLIKEVDTSAPQGIVTRQVGNLLIFSDVFAGISPVETPTRYSIAKPHFPRVNYIEVPFRVSRRIVALASVGAYLYIFGDRELLLLTGDPERDARIESIGDSIGAIHPDSVQQLSGVVYWLSDSGLLSVQGGQVREVGEPVRDQLTALGTNVSSTVDFRRECYYLTDGVTMLCYHTRENGWTTRQPEGSGPRLIYGGGTPYMQQGSTLYSIGGEAGMDGAPQRLPMRVRFPHYELGDWRTRKTFKAIAFGLDLATRTATVRNYSTADSRLDQTADTGVTVNPSGAGAVRLHTSQDGAYYSGAALSIEVEISSQDSRAIMRPPLTVYGEAIKGEEMWNDNEF